MSPAAVLRELKALDELEKRCREVKSPSTVLLAQIAKRREDLLNPVPVESSKPEMRK